MRSQFEDEIRKKLKDVSVDAKPMLFGAILLKHARLRRLRLLKTISFATITSLIIAGAGYFGYKATQNPSPIKTEISVVDDVNDNNNTTKITTSNDNDNTLALDVSENELLSETLSTNDARLNRNISSSQIQSSIPIHSNTDRKSSISDKEELKNVANDNKIASNYSQQELADKFKDILAKNEGSDINNAKIWTKLSDEPVEVPHRNIEVIETENDEEPTVIWKKEKQDDNFPEKSEENINTDNNHIATKDKGGNSDLALDNIDEDDWTDFTDEDDDENKNGEIDPKNGPKNKNKYGRITLEGSYGYGRAARSLSGTNRSLIETRNNSEISNYSDLSRIGVNVMLTNKWEVNAGIILGNRRSLTATTFQVPYWRDEITENQVEINVPGFGTRTITWYDTTQVEDIMDEEFKELNFQRTIRIPLSLSYTHYFDKYAIFCRGGVSVDVWTQENQTWIVGENEVRRTPNLPLKTDTYVRYHFGIGGGYRFHKNWMAIVIPTLDLGSNRITDQTLGIRQIDYGIFTTFGLRYNF